MTRPETRRASRKKPLGIGVIFVIILFLLNLIGLAAVVVSFVTPVNELVQEALAEVNFRGAPILDRLVEYVTRYICVPYDRFLPIQDFSPVQSAMMYLSVYYEVMMAILLFLYFPFAVLGHNRMVNKKGKAWRIVLQVLSILLVLGLIAFILIVSLAENGRFADSLDWIITKVWEPLVALFQPNGKLDVLCFTGRITTKLFAMGYLALGVLAVSFILNIIGLVGKNNYYGAKIKQLEKQPEPYRQLDPLGRKVPVGYGAIKLAPIPSAEHIVVVEPGQKPVLPKSIAPSEPQRKVVPVSYVPSAERAKPSDELPTPKPELVTVSTEEKKPEPKPEPEKVLVPTAERAIPETKEAPEPKPEPEPEKVVEEKPIETPVEPIPEIVTPEPEQKTILLKTIPVPEPELVPETKPVAVVKSAPKASLPEPAIEEKPEEVQPEPEPAPVEIPEEKPVETPVIPAPVPVIPAPVEEKQTVEEEKEEEPERVWIQPTYREVKILNALEPILPNDSLTLPAIRTTNVEAVLSNLEPFEKTPIETLPSESAEIAEAARKASSITPDTKPVDYLPGLDDNIAAPWEEEEEVEKTDVTEAAAPEPVEEPIIEEKEAVAEETVEEPAPVEEEKPVEEEAEEKVEAEPEEVTEEATEPAIEEKVEEIEPEPEPEPETHEPIHATVFPDKEVVLPEPVEEEEKTEEETVEETPAEEVVEETEEKETPEPTASVTAINHIPADDLRPQEEEHPENTIETGPSRYEDRVTLYKNNLEAAKETTIASGWTIPGYEEKPYVAPAEEVKTVVKIVEVPATETPKEEEKKEAAPPPVEEAPIEETVVEEKPAEPKRTFTLVDPLKRETVEEKVEEKKELSAISGPLHQIRERKRDIQLVAPTKVKFDLKQYKIKTYEGELTAEEAFLKGVTKVQPVVNPIFANQPVNDSWKQKKIDEENKKSGYFNVSQGKLVKPTRPLSQKPTTTKITSIRDLVKARKAQEKSQEKAEDDKKDAE